jgi:hypothetical protein
MPPWIPHSGDQSPTTSDQELDELMARSGTEEGPPPHLTAQPANPEGRQLRSPIPIRPINNQEIPGTLGNENQGRLPRG